MSQLDNESCIRAIFENAADGILTVDERGSIQSLNPAAARLFGYQSDELLGQNIRLLIPRPYLREHESYRPSQPPPPDSPTLSLGREVTGLHRHGHAFPLELSVSQSRQDNHTLYTAIVRDITQRKQAEQELTRSREQLRSLAARLQSIREEERSRISREIHDELGQALTGLKMDLAWLSSKLPVDRPELRQRAHSASELVDQTIQTVRRIAAELRPGILDNIGLVAAIEWQAQEFQNRTGIRCSCSARLDDSQLDPGCRTALFRILQETLTNVMRHAQATSVRIQIGEEAGQILLRVQDDGRGISENERADSQSLGLLGMQERASLLGGQFQISGRPNHGTTVTVAVPCRPSPPDPVRRPG